MSQVLVTDTKLTDIANSIRTLNKTNNTYTLTQMPDAILATYPYTLLYTTELTANNITSTSAATFATYTIGSGVYQDTDIIYVQIYAKNGPQIGYWYGGQWWNKLASDAVSAKTSVSTHYGKLWRVTDTGAWYSATANYYNYGIYPYTLTSAGKWTFRSRYNATYTTTIDGAYILEIYLLHLPTPGIFGQTITTT